MTRRLLHCRGALQQQLTAYQNATAWPAILQQEILHDVRPHHMMKSLQAVSKMSDVALAQSIEADRQKEYSWPIYWRALDIAWRGTAK